MSEELRSRARYCTNGRTFHSTPLSPASLLKDLTVVIKLQRGHYSDAVLSSLESQNDAEVEGITAKVKMLKDVCVTESTPPPLKT